MKTINLIPGSPEWIKARSASKLPAVMGCSRFMSRTELLHQMATGEAQEVDAATQARFDAGHAAEAAARPLAEEIIGEELSPVSAISDDGYLTANYDGITFMGNAAWECKLWNEKLAAAVRANDLPEEYKFQMDQQILVGDLDYVLFMVTDGTKDHCETTIYRSTPERLARVVNAWQQFDADLAAYAPAEAKREAVAAPQETLPAVTVQVSGSLAVIDNLGAFGAALTAYVSRINQKPETDDDFATLEAQAKQLKQAEDALTAAENGALAQAASIDEMRRAVAQYRDIARQARLTAEKVVKAEKENRKGAIIRKAADALLAYCEQLEAARFPVTMEMRMPAPHCDFIGAAKGLKTITSIQNAVDTELARAKIEASATADKIAANLKTIGAAGNMALFADYRMLAIKDAEHVALEVDRRITAAKAEEDRKLAVERERIAAEERAKINAQATVANNGASSLHVAPLPAEAAAQKPPPASDLVPAAASDALIREFLASREWKIGEEHKARAVLVEFVKFTASRSVKRAA